MITAIIILLPISIYTIVYVVNHNILRSWEWLFSLFYLLFGLMLAQQIVVRTSGMKYSEFLKNVKHALLADGK